MFHKIVITGADFFADEAIFCNALLSEGLEILHIRKPGAGKEEIRLLVGKIEKRYRNRIVLHNHYELAEEFGLKGIHIKYRDCGQYAAYADTMDVSISCHSMEEIRNIPFNAAYAFLSPVFESISKPGYGTEPVKYSRKELEECRIPVIALGGISPANIWKCPSMGFRGAAALGYIWNKPEDAAIHFTRLNTPAVLSIAGFDPSSGAGVSADIKTFEACGTYGYGAVSAITFQSSHRYESCKWISAEDLEHQIDSLLQHEKRMPGSAKIGFIENAHTLEKTVRCLKKYNRDMVIIWDPILQASATDRCLHDAVSEEETEKMLDLVDIITPNLSECRKLFGTSSPERLEDICRKHGIYLLLKGGHGQEGNTCTDRLYTPEGKVSIYRQFRSGKDKHGTGCLLSSALCSYIARGYSVQEAMTEAQSKIRKYIGSNDSLLGYRNIGRQTTILPAVSDVPLMFITDHKEGMTIAEQAEEACRGGIKWVQLRMKSATAEEMLATGRKVSEICRRFHVIFTVNDNVQVAKQLDADGVHLGKQDMSPIEARRILGRGKIIGATCNSFEDILQRKCEQVDYIGLGPFRFTSTKKNLSPILGLQGYSTLCKKMREHRIHLPVFAIGGITGEDFPELFQTGISGIALSGTLLRSGSALKNAFDLQQKAEKEKFNSNYK